MFAKICLFCGISFFASLSAFAEEGRVAVKIGRKSVTADELSFAYKNYTATEKEKRKTLDAFVQQYIDLQRKALAAEDARLDTVAVFRASLERQKARLLRPYLLTDAEKDSAARQVYQLTKDEFNGRPLLKVAAIFRYLPQDATSAQQQRERQLVDSLYSVLLKGGDFPALAKRYSSPGEAVEGYVPFWLATGRTWSDYETQAYTLKPGEFSKPFLSVRGFYIVKLLEAQPFPSFEAVKPRLLAYMKDNGLLLKLVQEKYGNDERKGQTENNVEAALFRKHPETLWQYNLYRTALLAAEWEQRGASMQELSMKYPVEVYEKVVRSIGQ